MDKQKELQTYAATLPFDQQAILGVPRPPPNFKRGSVPMGGPPSPFGGGQGGAAGGRPGPSPQMPQQPMMPQPQGTAGSWPQSYGRRVGRSMVQ